MRCNDVANLVFRRSEASGDLVSAYTEYEDVLREGARAEASAEASAAAVLAGHGVTLDELGGVRRHEALDAEVGAAFDWDDSAHGAPRWLVFDPQADPSGLDGDGLALRAFADRYNGRFGGEGRDISSPCLLEADPSRFVYVSVDDVLTHRGTRMRMVRKNGRWVQRSEAGDWIFHSVARIDADGLSLVLEARAQAAMFAQVLAALLANGLQDRTIVFFTDGEESLREGAEAVFSGWPHVLWLDYYHVLENLKGRLSSALRPGKVVDDTVEPQYFKNGKVKKSSIARITRSRYHLREVMSRLWAGNVAGAISYLRELAGRTDELKAGGASELEGAIGYLEKKGSRIPCYALRRHMGLRNSSNPVEIANNALVARRQKKKGMSWSDDGSFALSALTCVFENGCAESFFLRGECPLSLRETAKGRKERRTGLEWMLCEDVQIVVRRECELAETA